MNLSPSLKKHTPQFQQIGIMADSHGSPEVIESGIVYLQERNCRPIYHLGDICDSHRPETANECVRLLKENEILAIKGNNDYAILLSRDRKLIHETTHQYLETLPLIREQGKAFFVHSLPFTEELGLSSMIGVMRKRIAKRFFKEFDKNILFRGHSHSPEMIRQEERKILRTPIKEGEKINLKQTLPCIITCGALTEGLCMIWDQEEASLACLSFPFK
jgi:predicted phosphodiesterase